MKVLFTTRTIEVRGTQNPETTKILKFGGKYYVYQQ